MMRVWGRTSSINVQKVLWCLAELGQLEGRDFERLDAGLQFGVNNTPEYRTLNPNGLVPTLVDGDFVLWESHSIVRYLAARHDLGGLMPQDLQQRAHSERWMDWTQTVLWVSLRLVFTGLTRTPQEKWDIPALRRAWDESNVALRMLDQQLGQQAYCAGDRFTVGDIPLGVTVHRWLFLANQFPEVLEARPELPAVMRWYGELSARPAFRASVP
jgi:glutathione S-transferase